MYRLGGCLSLALLVSGARVLDAQAGSDVVGTIRDSSGAPVRSAMITASGLLTYSDTAGNFAFASLPSGKVTFSFRRLGFEPSQVVVELADGRRDSLAVTMNMLPRDLPGLTTTADSRRRQHLADFFRHRETGMGRYLDRAQIDALHVGQLSDALRRLPGIRLLPDRNGRYRLRMGRSSSNCPPDFWVDNVRAQYLNVDDIPLTDIEAIEVYNGPGGLPPEYNNRFGNPSCGAVVIWTRVPG